MDLRLSNIKISLILTIALITTSQAGVPLKRFEALINQQSTDLGLYKATDKVIILTTANFIDTISNRNYSSLVEFYNSYCGHCKRFAPLYNKLATDIYPWFEFLKVGAIDCAAEENNDICREYEVMMYPTLRYFSPGYAVNVTKSNETITDYGRKVETQNIKEIRCIMAKWLTEENRTALTHNWPNFNKLSEVEINLGLFEGLDSKKIYVVIVYEPENSTIGIETILNLRKWPSVDVRRVSDPILSSNYQIDDVQYALAIVDRQGKVIPKLPAEKNSLSYAEAVENFLKSQHYTEKPSETNISAIKSTSVYPLGEENTDENDEIIAEVHRNKHFVYNADLDMAIHGMLFNEVSKISEISGERLLALQNFLRVLKHYNPLGSRGKSFVEKILDFVMKHNDHLNGKDFENELHRLEKEMPKIFLSHQFIGCKGSRKGLRGFTCSIWTLFHYLTVQASTNDISQDPLEVLQALHGYIKYYFGCTDCSEHFQAMATRRKIWSVLNKDDAILWLWGAHNEVNKRLSGDETEDPEFPKIQFPSSSSCSKCYKEAATNTDINWDKNAVLNFLKNIYNPQYISRYGVENEDLLNAKTEKLHQKRMLGNVFSDMDVRMGMLLYGFCIVMLVVAFKLFVFKGYRKKPYAHDLLGKV